MKDGQKIKIIDRRTARALGKVFMGCYRRGINDAYEHADDEGLLQEHIEQTQSGSLHGFVGHSTKSYIYWHNRLSEIAENLNCYKIFRSYMDKMGGFTYNYLSAISMIAQDFYTKGLRDYMNYKNNDVSRYNDYSYHNTLWTPKGFRKLDGYRLRAIVQDMCASRIDRILNGGEDLLKQNHYLMFSNAFSFAIVSK